MTFILLLSSIKFDLKKKLLLRNCTFRDFIERYFKEIMNIEAKQQLNNEE